ncbi:MAG: hypothetical protein H7144_07655 [Burkholderiales bacterium]|nr:hypothetical protein [Phycisphaerae bacterium]
MGFDSGSISFQRYAVVGKAPKTPDEALLAKLGEHVLRPSDEGIPSDVEWGWIGPRHVFDTRFEFENCIYNDCVYFALRVDTNKIPTEVKHAWQTIEEDAVAKENPSGFISKQQKRSVKDSINGKLDEELRSGKYRRCKMIPVLWDLPAGVLYGPASIGVREKLTELFSRTFDLDLEPLSSGSAALRELERRGKRREYEDFTPTRFAKSPEDPDAVAEYPWTAKGDGAKDFMGNEFLLWLWYEAQNRSGSIRTPAGEITIMFDRTLQLDCVFNHTGRDTLTATGPTRLPEAIDAIRSGKAPRKAGLIVDWAGGQFNLTLTGESLAVSTLKLPAVEKADTPRTLFEERITLLRDFGKGLDSLFETFLTARASGWNSTVLNIQKWIASHVRPVAVAVA